MCAKDIQYLSTDFFVLSASLPPESKWPTFIGSEALGIYGPSEPRPNSFELAPDI